MKNVTKKMVERAIKSNFKVDSGFKMEKSGGHWWFIFHSDLEFGQVDLITSFTDLNQLSLDGWVLEFKRCYLREFSSKPTPN